MPISQVVFSEAEVTKIGIKFKGTEEADVNKCVGTLEEEMETKTVTKKCAGIVSKSRTKGTGNGTVKLSLHMEQDVFATMYGMDKEAYADGIINYGRQSIHPVFCLTAEVHDEDDNVKYKAYPNCCVQSGFSRKIENGAEEISEIEIEIAVMPDDDGNGLYEALEADLTNATIKEQWLSNFTSTLIAKTA